MTVLENSHDRSGFASALSAAISARGITLAHLREQLAAHGNPVSMASLSYWRSGARRPEGAQSLAVVDDLERILGLEPGALHRLLGGSLRTGPLGRSAFPFDEDPTEQRVLETFQALGADLPDPTRELSTHLVADVGPDRRIWRQTTRILLQAISGTVTDTPYVEITTGTPTPPPMFEAVAGGRVSALHSHPSREVHGFMFELDRPLISPETTPIEWSVVYPPEFPLTDSTGHGVALQARELMVWVRFHPDAVPDWCEEVASTPEGDVVTVHDLRGGRAAHAVRRGFGPGALSIRWGYGEQP